MRRLKGSKKEFRGLEMAVIKNLDCIHNILAQLSVNGVGLTKPLTTYLNPHLNTQVT